MVALPSPGTLGSPCLILGAPPDPTTPLCPLQTLLVEFYKGAPDLVKFQELWSHDQTYLDKLKVGRAARGGRFGRGWAGFNRGSPTQGSLASRTPKDQSFTHVLEQIFSLLKLSG